MFLSAWSACININISDFIRHSDTNLPTEWKKCASKVKNTDEIAKFSRKFTSHSVFEMKPLLSGSMATNDERTHTYAHTHIQSVRTYIDSIVFQSKYLPARPILFVTMK